MPRMIEMTMEIANTRTPSARARRIRNVPAVLFAVGWVAQGWGPVLEAGLTIASVLYGALLGVFLLGMLTERVGETAAMVGMSMSLLVMLYINWHKLVAFTWYVMIGTAVTVSCGYAASFVLRDRRLARS